MTSVQLILDGLLVVAAILLIGYRQLRWRAVEPARLWRIPIALGVIGLVMVAEHPAQLTPESLAVLALEAGLGLGVGALMGAAATLRPLRDDEPTKDPSARWAARLGWAGLGLLLGMIVLRVGLAMGLGALGVVLPPTTATVLLLIGANRAGWALLLQRRSLALTRTATAG